MCCFYTPIKGKTPPVQKGFVICQTDEMCRIPGHLPCDTAETMCQIFSGDRIVFNTAEEEGEICHQPWSPSFHALIKCFGNALVNVL